MDELPLEMIIEILQRVERTALPEVALVSRLWYELAHSFIQPIKTQRQLKAAIKIGDLLSLSDSSFLLTMMAVRYAYRFGQNRLIKVLFKKGPPWYEWNYEQCLRQACRGGQLHLVNDLLSRNLPLDGALEDACRGGHREIIEMLISHGAQKWTRGFVGACRGGHPELIKEMIRRGVSSWPNVWNRGLAEASRGGHQKLVQWMIQAGANDWNWGLVFASRGGHLAIVKQMVELGANKFDRALDNACKHGNRQTVDYLLSKCPPGDWIHGLNGACRRGHLGLVKEFIKRGVVFVNSALYIACCRGHLDVVKAILATQPNNVDRTWLDRPGADLNFCLGGACRMQRDDIVRYLLDWGVRWCTFCRCGAWEHRR